MWTRWVWVFGMVAAGTVLRASDTVGPFMGTVSSSSVQLLYRPSADTQELCLRVFDSNQNLIKVAKENCTAERDFVAHFTISGLQPDSTYQYQIERIDSTTTVLIAASSAHQFTTASPKRTGNRVVVSFVSCVDVEPTKIWNEMQRLNVDAVCLMGDTPYIDSSELETARSKHRQFLQMPDLARLGQTTPVIGTWDDHDFGKNNG
ncbi:alkaline phosphatase, partial [bacterium]|nr:alkaline phosphatase [bacterium]